jgi:sec-independent protein translocase protein TatC
MSEETVDQKQPLDQHLSELRTRFIRMFVAVVVAFGIAWFFHETLFQWLMQPYRYAMKVQFPELDQYIEFRSLIEPIVVYLKTSLLVGVIAVTPYLLLEIWNFVVPGLYARERKLGVRFLIASVLLFYTGVIFCRYVVLDPAITVLLGFGSVDTSPSIMMQEYFSFTSKMLFLFGALFELPVVITFLSLMGIITHETLIRHWRIALVTMFVVGAMLTPPDPLTQAALAVPLTLLYGVSIVISWMITRGRQEEAADDQMNPEVEEQQVDAADRGSNENQRPEA